MTQTATRTPAAREDIEFPSGAARCRGWRYSSTASAGHKAPILIMAHGLGGTRGVGLEPFAEAFCAAGFTVLLFDYRHFGTSDGEPRQLVTVERQLQDWRSAIRFARLHTNAGEARIVLWGTSFSGGHVLEVAASEADVVAVIAQCPMVDGLSAVVQMVRNEGVGRILKLSMYGFLDQCSALLTGKPVTIPIVAQPGQFAVMSSPGALQGCLDITSQSWVNRMTARVALTLAAYRPINRVRSLRCPVLVQAFLKDTVTPAKVTASLVARNPSKVRLREYDIGHFEGYVLPARDQVLADQLRFLKQLVP